MGFLYGFPTGFLLRSALAQGVSLLWKSLTSCYVWWRTWCLHLASDGSSQQAGRHPPWHNTPPQYGSAVEGPYPCHMAGPLPAPWLCRPRGGSACGFWPGERGQGGQPGSGAGCGEEQCQGCNAAASWHSAGRRWVGMKCTEMKCPR